MSFGAASQSQWGTSPNLIRFHLPVTSLEQGKRIVPLWPHPGLTPRVGVLLLERKDRSWEKVEPPLPLSFLSLSRISSRLVIPAETVLFPAG